MKKIALAVTNSDDWTAKALFNALTYFKMHPVTFSFTKATSNINKIYAQDIALTEFDAIIIRDLGPATNNDIFFKFDILTQLKELGIEIINSPESIAKAANKYASSYLFKKNNITTPETIVTTSYEDALNTLSSYDNVVIKPIFGYKGIGVECLKNDDKSKEKIKKVLERDGIIYIQKFIPNLGRDIRAFVVDKKIVGSIYRYAPIGSWINNLSQGGSAKICKLTQKQKQLALKASELIGTVYSGVDIIEGDKDYVIEINGTPSGKGIFDACGIDVSMDIARYLKEKL